MYNGIKYIFKVFKVTNSEKAQVESKFDNEEKAAKWDYTSSSQNMFIGGLVVGLNVLLLLAFALYRTVPSVHSFIAGKP